MTDSPAHRIPLDPAEQPILDKLLIIRDKLSLLKQDKTKYVQSKDITGLYEEVIEEAEKLNSIRVTKRDEQNRRMCCRSLGGNGVKADSRLRQWTRYSTIVYS